MPFCLFFRSSTSIQIPNDNAQEYGPWHSSLHIPAFFLHDHLPSHSSKGSLHLQVLPFRSGLLYSIALSPSPFRYQIHISSSTHPKWKSWFHSTLLLPQAFYLVNGNNILRVTWIQNLGLTAFLLSLIYHIYIKEPSSVIPTFSVCPKSKFSSAPPLSLTLTKPPSNLT